MFIQIFVVLFKGRTILRSKLKKDSTFREFWRDNERFADLFNGAVFGGAEVICAESLQEMDTDVSGTIKMDGYSEGLERRRDVVKKFADDMTFVLLGVEAQQHIHYAMPLRHMLYDGMGYLKEYRSLPSRTGKFQTSDEFLSKMKKEDKLHPIITLTVYYGETPWDGPLNLRDMMADIGKFQTSDEFLSKMKKEDKLHPIITLTVYYGETPWDGPLNLRDMMADIPKAMEGAFCNYSMNLLEIRKSGEYVFHNKDIIMAFDFTRAVFESRVDEAIQKYKDAKAGEEVWNFIDTMIDSEKMIEQTHTGGDNMCEGLRLWAQEKANKAEQAGLNRGLNQGLSRGITQGLSCGITQGRREGELVGEISGQKMIINRMIENNISLEKIAHTMIDSEKMIEQTHTGGDNMCEGLRLWAQEKANKAEQAGLNRGLNQGLSRGITQGLSCGITQGRREGELVGEISGQKMIINRMIENNISLEKIAQLIGFPVEKVKEILETEKVYH